MIRENNFDFLRLVFSSLVIFSHSFPLTKTQEPVAYLNASLTIGEIAVHAFFIMSGFLIFNSMITSKNLLNYIWKRCLRLFPGLFVMLLLTTLFLPIINVNIIHQKDYYTYLPSCLSLFKVQYVINNIFVDNPYPKAINGSLWSLCYEFLMYLFIGALFIFKKSRNLSYFVFASFIIFHALNIIRPDSIMHYISMLKFNTVLLFRLASFFMAGACFSYVKSSFLSNNYVRISLLVLLCLSVKFSFYYEFAPFAFTVLLIPFATSFNKQIQLPKSLGDISYGVYVYGFVVQQIFMHYFNLSALTLFIFALIITYIFSYFSWHYVEKPVLRYKNLLNK